MSDKNFYRAFENKYRGSRERIKNRLKVYLPFILPLKKIYPNETVIDIGCGRGEWLELLTENNINARGIDMDEGMLSSCQELNLNTVQGNGILMLQEQPDESTILISAFHVIEHISFDELQTLIKEALRVLKPGGLLILETPNAENLKVASESFYLDPTHIRPIPSILLSFLTEYNGYIRSKILRLQEPEGLSNQTFASLGQVIEGVSPDYAVIAQKSASTEILALLDNPFLKEFGLSLSTLSEKFEMRMLHFETEINNAKTQANEALVSANEAWHHYNLVLNSTSWKITKPLRFTRKIIQWFIRGSIAWLRFTPESRPRRVLNQLLVLFKHNINTHQKPKVGSVNNHTTEALSPRAKQIYNDLKKTIENQRDEN